MCVEGIGAPPPIATPMPGRWLEREHDVIDQRRAASARASVGHLIADGQLAFGYSVAR
jgi:hypothetical protein